MSVFTQLSASQLKNVLAPYPTGAVLSFKALDGGISNSNYRVQCERGEWVLTITETGESIAEVEALLNQQGALSQHLEQIPKPLESLSGSYCHQFEDKAASLVSFVQGQHLQPNAQRSHQIANWLARLHQLPVSLAPVDAAFAPQHIDKWLDWQYVPENHKHRCQDIIKQAQAVNWQQLPQSMTHNDLFADNVLWQGKGISAVIDWHFSGRCCRAYDVAITQLAWLDSEHLQQTGFLAAYQANNKLEELELNLLPLLRDIAVIRFASRRQKLWQDPHILQTMKKNPDPLWSLI